jgi:hypothetical protein
MTAKASAKAPTGLADGVRAPVPLPDDGRWAIEPFPAARLGLTALVAR